MNYRLVIEYFGKKMQNISGVDNIVADTLGIIKNSTSNHSDTSYSRYLCYSKTYSQLGVG